MLTIFIQGGCPYTAQFPTSQGRFQQVRRIHSAISLSGAGEELAEREVGLKLPADTIRAFAEEGEDWKERMAQTLTEAARKKHAA